MKTLLADQIVEKAEGAPAKDSTPTGKLSKKERMKLELKQELKADIGNVLQQMDSVRKDTDPMLKHCSNGCIQRPSLRELRHTIKGRWSREKR